MPMFYVDLDERYPSSYISREKIYGNDTVDLTEDQFEKYNASWEYINTIENECVKQKRDRAQAEVLTRKPDYSKTF